jgi:hypothetical protein
MLLGEMRASLVVHDLLAPPVNGRRRSRHPPLAPRPEDPPRKEGTSESDRAVVTRALGLAEPDHGPDRALPKPAARKHGNVHTHARRRSGFLASGSPRCRSDSGPIPTRYRDPYFDVRPRVADADGVRLSEVVKLRGRPPVERDVVRRAFAAQPWHPPPMRPNFGAGVPHPEVTAQGGTSASACAPAAAGPDVTQRPEHHVDQLGRLSGTTEYAAAHSLVVMGGAARRAVDDERGIAVPPRCHPSRTQARVLAADAVAFRPGGDRP